MRETKNFADQDESGDMDQLLMPGADFGPDMSIDYGIDPNHNEGVYVDYEHLGYMPQQMGAGYQQLGNYQHLGYMPQQMGQMAIMDQLKKPVFGVPLYVLLAGAAAAFYFLPRMKRR